MFITAVHVLDHRTKSSIENMLKYLKSYDSFCGCNCCPDMNLSAALDRVEYIRRMLDTHTHANTAIVLYMIYIIENIQVPLQSAR